MSVGEEKNGADTTGKRLSGSRIAVTGSGGFLGRTLCELLEKEEGAKVLRLETDLLDGAACEREIVGVLEEHGGLDHVFHLAGYNGGISFNRRFPADVFHVNTVMGLNLLDALAGREGVGRVWMPVASCAWDAREGILREEDFLSGSPDDSVACHAYAKRNLLLAARFYRRQYGIRTHCPCPSTLYGPGDRFHPEVRCKVVAGTIRRIVDAMEKGLEEITVPGTGSPLRELLHVRDCARLLILVASLAEERGFDDSDKPLNLSGGQELSVAELVRLVARLAGWNGRIVFDPSRPDGQARKLLRTDRARLLFPEINSFRFTPLAEGIAETIRWWKETLGR